MLPEKTEAVVIRQADFSETSKVVTLFTRDFGKVAALAKGAKRLKGPFETALDLLNRCRIVFLRKSSAGLDLLTEAQLISRFRPAGRNMAPVYAGWYLAELLDALTEPHDPHPALYQEAVSALERFPADADLPKSILRFELATLREIGQLPAFDGCLSCGADAATRPSFSFWVTQGGLICGECRREEFTTLMLDAGTLTILRRLCDENDTSWETLEISPTQHRALRRIVTAAVSHTLGRRPKMLAYLSAE